MNPVILCKQVSEELCKFISTEMRIMEGVIQELDPQSIRQEPEFGDSYNAYCPPCLEALSLTVKPIIEKLVDKELAPSYSYGRIYRPGARLNKHFDRRSSEFSVSICLEKGNTPWFLCADGPDSDNPICVDLSGGDMLVYSGAKISHWREGPYEGDEQIQVFIQYVDVNGENADLIYDGRPKLGLPFGYKSEFVEEELQDQLKLGSVLRS